MATRAVRELTTMAFSSSRGGRVVTPADHIALAPRDWTSIYCCGAPAIGGPCPLCTELLGFSYVNVPKPRILIQEWVHTYGIEFNRVDGLFVVPQTPSILDGVGHWGRFTDINGLVTSGGGVGSTILTVNPDLSGTFACEKRSDLHAYDLYVMGLIPDTALPDARVMIDPVLPPGSCTGTFSDLFTHPAAELVLENGGPRSPFPGVTAYNAVIIAVTPDSSFTAAERAYFELYATFLSSGPPAGVTSGGDLHLPFGAATGGLATVDTTIVLR